MCIGVEFGAALVFEARVAVIRGLVAPNGVITAGDGIGPASARAAGPRRS